MSRLTVGIAPNLRYPAAMTGRFIRFRKFALAAASAISFAVPASAEKVPPISAVQADSGLRIDLVDLTPRFLAFYRAAEKVDDPDSRFALWKEHYGFGAFPPGPKGDELARELLDSAWPHYAGQIESITRGAAMFGDEPIRALRAVARLLEAEPPLNIRLVAYVGGFEDNAFAARDGDTPVVSFPVEMSADKRRLIMPHEFTHAVHQRLANLSGGWERSIAATLLQEGLAMHVARELAPGENVAAYVEHEPGWWAQAIAKRQSILCGILPSLEARDGDSVFRFTMGTGPAGLNREAYAAGWWVIEQLRREGMSLAEIARVPEDEMPDLARRAIDSMIER